MTGNQGTLFDPDPDPWHMDDGAERRIAQVVFADPPHGPFDYLVPDGLAAQIEPGRRVRVPLGRGNRPVVGYVVGVDTQPVGPRTLKPVRAVVDRRSLVSPGMLRLTEWMADYYLCPLGRVLDAVVPAGVRGQAGTREKLFLSVPTKIAARYTQLNLPDKQRRALEVLISSPKPLTPHELAEAAGCTHSPINQLRRKQLVEAQSQRVYETSLAERTEPREVHLQLNDDQQRALDTILNVVNSRRYAATLLHGVTGSGKTEVYIRAIDEVIHFGRQAIVLVPEISLTPQTCRRFRSRFDRVAVLHSHLSPAERHGHWQRIAGGEVQVIVGARSAIFAPTPHLGLIVLDEEHDASFKQDSAPRYHARDVAVQRARMENIPLVLGSATPSLESWRRAQQGKYHLVEMPQRVSQRPMPHVGTIDLRNEFHSRHSRGAVSRPLHQAMARTLKEDGQIILLLNRRGFATNIQCPACGHVVKCPQCDLALTHHREGQRAICHWCDYQIVAPPRCPQCNFEAIRYSGLGTQRLEAEIRARFPRTTCLRMDSDTMQRPGSHEEALRRFRQGEVKILLGTQMIAKGLDFPNVTLVGVINADTALHFPDFRAAERTFQLVTQVAGRTGRGDKGGRVLVQTFSPDHPAIEAALKHDYVAFANQELPIREDFGYPPDAQLIRLVFRGPSENPVEQFADQVAQRLEAESKQQDVPVRLLGPAPAPIAKLRGLFRFHLLCLAGEHQPLQPVVRAVTGGLEPPDEVQWMADVDAVDLL